MESMELTWQAYGDVNPLEHGGVWALPNKDSDTDFFIVKVTNSDDTGIPGFQVYDVRIDINDYNLDDMESVKSFIGADEDTENVLIAIGFLDYYGAENLGGSMSQFDTEEEARVEIESHGVDL